LGWNLSFDFAQDIRGELFQLLVKSKIHGVYFHVMEKPKPSGKDLAQQVQGWFNSISAAKELVRRASQGVIDDDGSPVLIETFVIDEIHEWKPEGREQRGWVLFPLMGEVYTSLGITITGVELVAFEELKVIPQIGDLIILKREVGTMNRKAVDYLRPKELV